MMDAAPHPECLLTARTVMLRGTETIAVDRLPSGGERARAIVVPPFGDEMNQSRRMLRRACEALCTIGVGSRMTDLHGTGDSAADFEAATVDGWVDECAALIDEAAEETRAPVVLLACRLGMALALRAVRGREGRVRGVVGWAPVLSGAQQLSLLLRAQAIARIGSTGVGGRADAHDEWASGRIVRLGGYAVAPALAAGLRSLDVRDEIPGVPVRLIELRTDASGGASPAVGRIVEDWRSEGADAEARVVAGTPFWNVADLVDADPLLTVTREVVASWL
jgi:exosortase A-associated hydrolase 2